MEKSRRDDWKVIGAMDLDSGRSEFSIAEYLEMEAPAIPSD